MRRAVPDGRSLVGDLAGGAILVFAYAMARIYRSKTGFLRISKKASQTC